MNGNAVPCGRVYIWYALNRCVCLCPWQSQTLHTSICDKVRLRVPLSNNARQGTYWPDLFLISTIAVASKVLISRFALQGIICVHICICDTLCVCRLIIPSWKTIACCLSLTV